MTKKLKDLKPTEVIPDGYRRQVVDKIDSLNEKLSTIKRKNKLDDEWECDYQKELKWIQGYYLFTTLPVCDMLKDVKRIKYIEYCIEFMEFCNVEKDMFNKKEIETDEM